MTEKMAAKWGFWLVAIAVSLVMATGCRSWCDEECAGEGLCSVRMHRAGDGPYRCYAGSDSECADSRVCREDGRCFATDKGACVVEGAVDSGSCSTSMECTRRGQCGHRDGVCWADSDADCAASFECRTVGRCWAQGGVCLPRTDADCERSLGCEVEGLCHRFSYMRMTSECRVPMDDAGACERSWVCEHYGRCAPASPAECEGCPYGFCAEPGRPGVRACSSAAAVIPGCGADGRCAPDENYECAHAPVEGPRIALAPDAPQADPGLDNAPAAGPARGGEEPEADSLEQAAPAEGTGNSVADWLAERERELATGEPSTPPVPDLPPGPGSIAFAFGDIDGQPYEGVLMHASLLTGAVGFQPDPVDFLVLRATPETGCNPRSSATFLPLGAIWLTSPLPAGEGTFEFEGGPIPGQMAAKTWLWTGDRNSGSRNYAMHGTIEVTARSATELRGRVDFRVTEYFTDTTIGTVRGAFVANVVDCSTHTGGWPM